DSDSHAMYRDMLDQQLAAEMAGGKGIGLADMIVRQIGSGHPTAGGTVGEDAASDSSGPSWFALNTANARSLPLEGRPGPVSRPAAVSTGGSILQLSPLDSDQRVAAGDGFNSSSVDARPATHVSRNTVFPVTGSGVAVSAEAHQAGPGSAYGWSDPASFARDLWPHAQRVADRLKVAPEAVMAQAALETGWGQHMMPRADGAISNNLFGIKASAGWQGESVARRTLEFAGGVPRQEVARFRAYDDVAASFDDYAAFLSENPRYRPVLENGSDIEGFARAIGASGYATDPEYANKISRVANGELMHEVLAPLKNAPTSSIGN
ncbi:MAG: flagellar assembly peptidoglycan hydrolase FlgJ, partial [Pseudomonadota bacterium]